MPFPSYWISGGVGPPEVTPEKGGNFDDALALALSYGPTAGGGDAMPEYTEGYEDLGVVDEDVNNVLVPVRRGVRWVLTLKWDNIDIDSRGLLVSVVNLALAGYRFWLKPHNDSDRRVLCELNSPFDVSELFQKQAVGYGPCSLTFKSVAPLPFLYHDDVVWTWTAVCGGLTLDGLDDQVDFGNGVNPLISESNLDTTGDKLEVEFYWRPEAVATDRRIVHKGGAFTVYQTAGAGSGTRLEAEVTDSVGPKRTSDAGWSTDLANGTWCKVNVVADGAKLRVYVEDVDMGGEVAYTGPLATTANNLYVGSDGAADYAKGAIKQLRMFDPDDSDRNMLEAAFIEGSGTEARDTSPGANHGAITSATWYEPSYEDAEIACWGDVEEKGYTSADRIGQWTGVGEVRSESGEIVAYA
jgi:hypothetical protein